MNLEQLNSMTVSQLRGLDIKNKEEEMMVQGVLNKKIEYEPHIPNRPPVPTSVTDKLTPEKERELQAELDGVAVSLPVNMDTSSTATTEELKPGRFCEFCDAKGPIKHKKNCPKSK